MKLGKRLRLFREKAQNKRMKNAKLSTQESLKDEVAHVLTTTSLLKEVQSAIKADKEKRWYPQPSRLEPQEQSTSSKRHKSSSFRKCENTTFSAVAINAKARNFHRWQHHRPNATPRIDSIATHLHGYMDHLEKLPSITEISRPLVPD